MQEGNLKSGILAYLAILVFLWCPFSHCDPLDNWHTRISGSAQSLECVTYGDGIFVAVGGSGTILTSSNGTAWQSQESGITNGLRGVTYGNGLFVAVGASGTILTSPDGATWRSPASGTNSTLFSAVYGNNTFVAVGNGSDVSPTVILTSTDGLSWHPQTSGIGEQLWSVTYGNNTFVAVGTNGIIITSTDGTKWYPRTSETTELLSGVVYGNSIFVAVGASGSILTSQDGTTWHMQTSVSPFSFLDIAYGNNTFVTVIASGLTPIATSVDGHIWCVRTIEIVPGLWHGGISYGSGTFVLVDGAGDIFQSDPYVKGDIDGSGQMNIVDGLLCLSMVTGQDRENLPLADMNSDGVVDTTDLILLLRKVIGLN